VAPALPAGLMSSVPCALRFLIVKLSFFFLCVFALPVVASANIDSTMRLTIFSDGVQVTSTNSSALQ
jgi:hypothetical protein